jgi:hypothetical protein
MRLSARRFAGTPVTGAPYSAQRVTEHVQTSADGTRFTTTTQQETVYRDSQGRTRTERPLIMGPNAPDAPLLVEISDPVANMGYTLDTQNKVAHRVAYSAAPLRQSGVGGVGVAGGGGGGSLEGIIGAGVPPGPGIAPTAAQTVPPPPGGGAPSAVLTSPVPGMTAAASQARSGRPNPEVTRETLGNQLIEGTMAEGQRFVQTWPAGSQGNDRPFQTTSESWFSQELKLMVLNKNLDPRSGENTMKLVNINRAEPPSTLFQPPVDYTIVDETGPFEIQWTGARRQ